MELEQMTIQELSTVKGGKWVLIGDRWAWVDTLDLDPEEVDI